MIIDTVIKIKDGKQVYVPVENLEQVTVIHDDKNIVVPWSLPLDLHAKGAEEAIKTWGDNEQRQIDFE